MTTSHRPQLEARSGAKSAAYVPTNIQHARLLPGHLDIKYRSVKKSEVVDETPKILGAREESDSGSNDINERRDVNSEDSSNEYSDTGESEDDSEALLEELKRLKEDQAGTDRNSLIKVSDNPKENRKETNKKNENSSWRSKTTFGRQKNKVQKNKNKDNLEYINDLTKSKYHQDFLKKFVK